MMNEESENLSGVRLYKPGAIAVYMALSGIPVGLFLYGLNISRRGQTLFGRILCVVAAVMFLMMVYLAMVGERVSGFGIIGIFVAIWIWKTEQRPLAISVRRGATAASWWPPLVWLIGLLLIMSIIVTFVVPE